MVNLYLPLPHRLGCGSYVFLTYFHQRLNICNQIGFYQRCVSRSQNWYDGLCKITISHWTHYTTFVFEVKSAIMQTLIWNETNRIKAGIPQTSLSVRQSSVNVDLTMVMMMASDAGVSQANCGASTYCVVATNYDCLWTTRLPPN